MKLCFKPNLLSKQSSFKQNLWCIQTGSSVKTLVFNFGFKPNRLYLFTYGDGCQHRECLHLLYCAIGIKLTLTTCHCLRAFCASVHSVYLQTSERANCKFHLQSQCHRPKYLLLVGRSKILV